MIAENEIKDVHSTETSDQIPLQLRKGQMFGDSLGMAGNTLIALIFASFTMYYLTTIVHLDGIILGTLVLVGSIFGSVASFITGILIDKLNSKYGKVRPWLLISLVPMAGALLLLFSIPEGLATSTKMVWAGACIIFFNIGTSMFGSASGSLIPMATRNPVEVTKMGSGRAMGNMVGAMVVSMGYVPLVGLVGGDQRAYFLVTATIIIIASLLIINQFRTSRENVKSVKKMDEAGVEQKVPFKDALLSILKNNYFLVAALVLFASTFMLSLNNAATVYYAQYVLGNINMQSILSMIGAIPGLIIFPLLPTLVKRLGTRWVVVIGTLLVIVGCVIRLMSPSNIPLAIAGFTLSGVGSIPLAALITVLVNSTIDYGEWKSGIRSPGLMMSLVGIATMLASSLSVSSIGWILGATGYDGAAAQQSASAMQGILSISIYLPIILAGLSFVCMLFWRLEKKLPQIVSELRARNGE
ncbi:MFS transporter [Paenibacillus sanguinis]|uniref:MFS transporter n=1 Tax=Paenibacillus sanguinis TaxID=225906 RepID=UPI00037FFA3F|nr:glycoside-pentoside-hexuronide (GPH):cation symporter [Paenibacillus sanguinis]